ncbi:protein FAR1-RELATED SEQUENCE 3-like [Beta vulgaris subsp. vulgaris]|uniref:protein FAR1-RELATED SEQUENCE 3-like n=1 Tax=Beta vulgaris subsp. vulgaris TaxID=3555 RepID=UPI0020373864|nr:protein FAR1-RELATED SEQUENCE 3-like [Beta vulgaris subsp. vulgaris]
MMYGEAESLLRYFHLQAMENPSFQYSVQLDCEEKITNIFWADAKIIIDYSSFGEVVAFDTTFHPNKENRPLGVFVGFNHFRETVVFGAALLYDETIESFKWLFETFLATHDNKHPKTIFTYQDMAMGIAIVEVMPGVWHGLCTWHIKKNATKHLLSNGADIFREFKACMYNIEQEAEFEKAFDALHGKVKKVNCFQDEYELSTAAYVKDVVEGQLHNEYRVAIFNLDNDSSIDKEYLVFGDASTKTVSCSCRMFQRSGILCAHALKVLDDMNIKLIPDRYMLKRWTTEARSGVVQDRCGRTVLEDPRLEATRRYKALCRKFLEASCQAYNFVEVSSLVDSGLDNIIVKVNKKGQA